MKETAIRNSLGTLLAFISLNALGGGWYGMTGAREIPADWLKNSPFHDYFIPSLFLFLVLGGSFTYGAIAVFRRKPWARNAALGCGAFLLFWIAAQVFFIGFVSWLQPAMFAAGCAVLLLARQLPEA